MCTYFNHNNNNKNKLNNEHLNMYESSQVLSSSIRSEGKEKQIEFFKSTLKNSGVILQFKDDFNVITQEQALVVRDMEKIFANEHDGNDKFKEFLTGIKLLCRKENYFRKALLSTHLKKSGDVNESFAGNMQIEQESLFRILLKVSDLQPHLINIIFHEIVKTASEETQDTSWLRLLLSPLRYLPYIQDPKKLSEKLLDSIEVATFVCQLELLDSIPEIVPDSEQNTVAKELNKLLDRSDQLTGAIIDCLNAMNLDAEIRMEIHDRILAKLSTGVHLATFPVLLEFLLGDVKLPNLVHTLLKIRNALDSLISSGEQDKDRESQKLLIFNRIQTYTRASKTIAEGWLNMISSIQVHSDHKPIDILILFMLHNTVKNKKRIVESTIRKRISSGLFKIPLLEKMFKKYVLPQILYDHFKSILQIGSHLLHGTYDVSVIEFTTTLFRILFKHELMQTIYRRELIDNLILTTVLLDKNNIEYALNIFTHFLHDDISKLRQHTLLLMRLLEKLDSFNLKNVKQVFDILCALTCSEDGEESLPGLKDEIHMIIRKQLSSNKRIFNQQGIVAAVVMAKYLAKVNEQQSELDEDLSIMSSQMLPNGSPREAASLLELTIKSIANCPELMGLYYDQLAAMLFSPEHLDKFFMGWLEETITNNFTDIYITETVPESYNDLEFSLQYSLNTIEETTTTLGVNVAELTINPNNTKKAILILAPAFRLLRLLNYRQRNADLSKIDALLGCGVILPKLDNIDVTDLTIDQKQQVADCLFHCINWFREIISGFVTQKSRKLRAKVIQRLEHLMVLEDLLKKCLEEIPDHKLPVSYFDSLSQVEKQKNVSPNKPNKQSKKKVKSTATVDQDETMASTIPATSKTVKKVAISHNEFSINFREIDTDLILLLKYPLKFDDDDESEDVENTASAYIKIEQLKFILSDFNSKLETLTKGKNTGLSHLNVIAPSSIITDCILILPKINNHLTVLISKITKLLEQTDGRLDLPEMFTPQANQLKDCFGLILQSFLLIFGWSGFQHSKNIELLKSLLKSLAPEQSQTIHSANKLILDWLNQLENYTDNCLLLSHAVNLVKIMETLYATTVPSRDVEKKILKVTSKLLSIRWYNKEGILDSGKNCNSNMDYLIKVYLKPANIKTISGLVGTLQEEAPKLLMKDDCLLMLSSIDKRNFHLFYQGLCSALQNRVKIEIQSISNHQHLVLWKTTVLTMQGLMTISKVHETKPILSCFLKKSIAILKVFLSHGIPILEIMLRSKTDDVIEIFKTMQTNTRFLHHLCCYSRLTKDTAIIAHVPQFRLTLESLVYRVKAALVANNCEAAFWMGNLRNRDIHGEDILTQSTVLSEDLSEVNETGEELPENEDDMEIDDEETKSDSEVFE